MNRSRHINTGFTLTELLVVILIVGILAGIGVPSYQHFVQNQRVREASQALLLSLSLARSEAIKRNLDVEMVPNDSNHWEQGWKVLVLGFDDPLRTQPALNGVVINLSFGDSAVVYRKSGRILKPSSGVSEPAFQVDVTDATLAEPSDKVRCVKTALSGLPRILQEAC